MPGEKNFFQTFGEAFAKGDIFTKVSFLVWGLGYIGHGQLMKALLVTLVEGLGLYFLAFFGAPNLAKFGTLGTVKMEMVFDVATMKNVVNNYDNSFEILLMSMISFVVIAALVAAAMLLRQPLILVLIAFWMLMSSLSVIIQVTYFKKTGGKRIFKMSPIHHHFELCGMSEFQIVAMYMTTTLVLCLIALMGVL